MDPFWDENNEEERLRRKLDNFYGDFSAEARNKLLAKNVERPNDIYEIFYMKVRDNLLAKNKKNTIFSDNLNDSSKSVRDALLAKNIPNGNDLLQKSENIKKSLEARNKLIDNRDDLLNKTEQIRDNLLAKNVDIKSDLESQSEIFRNNLKAKNSNNSSFEESIDATNLEKESEGFRDNLKAKNLNSKEGDLAQESEIYRDNLKAKNSSVESRISEDSEEFRKGLVSKNKKSKSLFANDDLEENSETFRKDLLSKNNPDDTDLQVSLEEVFESTRQALLAKNVDRGVNLLEFSEVFRDALVAKNVSNVETFDTLFDDMRRSLLVKNDIHKIGEDDLVGKSEQFKNDLLAKNVVNDTSLEILFEGVRNDLLAKNKSIRGEALIDMFDDIREGLLAKNQIEQRDTLDILFEQERKNLVAKNTPSTSSLEIDSSPFRKNLVSNNSSVETDLESDSTEFRKSLVSNNSNAITDLETDSADFREGLVSANEGRVTDLESDSTIFREDLVSANDGKITDIDTDSNEFREDLISYNTPKFSDLDIDSTVFRNDLVSNNTPKFSDLDIDSTPFRDDLLSNNSPNTSDLESDSTIFRDDLVSRNVPFETDIESDSTIFRDDLVSKNVPFDTDLEGDSAVFRSDLEARNVPNDSDLEDDSGPFRDGLESRNVPSDSDLEDDSVPFRDGLESRNVPNGSNLLTDSTEFRSNVVSKNVSNDTNLIIDSEEFKNSLDAKNVINESDILRDSRRIKEDLLARNTGGLLGFNINAAGTSTFFGVSRVLTQGILFRKLLTSRNEALNRNAYVNEFGEFITDGAEVNLQDSQVSENSALRNKSENINATRKYNDLGGANNLYGTGLRPGGQSYNASRDGAAYIDDDSTTLRGTVTDAARRYNISRNIYAPSQNELRNVDAFRSLQEDYANTDLPGLISGTIGALTSPGVTGDTPTTPFDVILNNNGGYLKSSPEKILNPTDSIVAKQGAGNLFMDEDFRTGRRGVKRVINTIKNSDLSFAKNFDPQNSKEYITGLKPDGETVRKGFQRYTVANPYAPEGAEKMRFLLINYSMDRSSGGMTFPPYITAFQHGSSVNWNTVEFLGRPEPLYTYNNTKRSGSISFFVLTDYAQSVDIGVDFESGENITETFDKSFTDYNKVENVAKIEEIKGLIKQRENDIKEINQNRKDNATASETATVNVRKQELLDEIRNLTTEVWELNRLAAAPNYSEASILGQNVYKDVIGRRTRENGEYSSTPEDTQTRLNQMKQDLKFQPAYFSGDKVDFVRKVEFLEKTTRPSRNDGPGFSFIKPPICHMHLGDWFNHDIVVNSIDYDYTDAPWTFDGGRVQPMYVQVTMSFDIIGRYRHTTGPPILSTDVGGFFSDANTFKAKK